MRRGKIVSTRVVLTKSNKDFVLRNFRWRRINTKRLKGVGGEKGQPERKAALVLSWLTPYLPFQACVEWNHIFGMLHHADISKMG